MGPDNIRITNYAIVSKGITAFSMDMASGVISTAQTLDYETQHLYQFSIEGTQSQADLPTYTANVTINVLDVNDNSPVFSQSYYTATLPSDSNSLKKWSTTVAATDADSGSNAAITYSITDGGDVAKIFSINSTSGEIRATGTLDEGKSSFVLPVQAMDGGTPTRNGQAIVVITVPCDSKAMLHSAKPLLYLLLPSLVLLVLTILGM